MIYVYIVLGEAGALTLLIFIYTRPFENFVLFILTSNKY